MSIPTYLEQGSDPISENLVLEKRRPSMMFTNSGFTGGGSKQGHFRRVQKSKPYLPDNDQGSNHVYETRNTKLIEVDGVPFPKFNLQTIHPRFKTMKDNHVVSIKALIIQF